MGDSRALLSAIELRSEIMKLTLKHTLEDNYIKVGVGVAHIDLDQFV